MGSDAIGWRFFFIRMTPTAMKNLCIFVTGITGAVSNLPTFHTGYSMSLSTSDKTRPSVFFLCRFDGRSATNGATGARSGRRVPRRERAGTGRAGRCHAFPPADGRREGGGCGTRRRCDRASLRTRLRSRRDFPNSLSRSNRSPRPRGLLARRRRAAGPDSGAAGGGLAAHLESPLPHPERSHPPSLPFPTRPGRPPRRRTGAWRSLPRGATWIGPATTR